MTPLKTAIVLWKTMDTSFHRVLILTWLLSCFVLSAAYAGNLRGFLTNPKMTPEIKSLQQVLDSGLPYYYRNIGYESFQKKHVNPTVAEMEGHREFHTRPGQDKVIS